MKITFELQSNIRGRWSIEQVFAQGEKEKAIDEAKRRVADKHVSAVRVIRENYNTDTNESTEVVVFDTSRPPRGGPSPAPAAAKTPPAKKQDKPGELRRAKKSQHRGGVAGTLVMAMGLVIAVAVLIIAFSRGQQLLSSAGLG